MKFFGEGDGCDGFNGNFLENNRENIILFYNLKEACSENTLKDIKCKIIPISNSFYFTQKIRCDNNKEYFNHQKPISSGLLKVYKDIKIETLALKSAIAKTNINLRKLPSISSTKFNCHFEHLPINSKLEPGDFTFIPKDYSMTVIGKTIEKDKIEGKENYWFLVIPATNAHNGCLLKQSDQLEGWVFGEYLEFIN
ncbi:hypothetical protein EHR08_19430 [Leptospira bandrabouensis]|uniref:Uncharacterized protein n=1 Tax=Leptospira bandrabouensis TaxID=2484903 RepID=A0A6H3NPG2_9LEPT|nr:hypothetical protein EHR08_19430 [Leptospira bandrabouensis]